MDDGVWLMVMVELVSSCLVDACGWSPLLDDMAWSHDAYVLLSDGCCLDDKALDDG